MPSCSYCGGANQPEYKFCIHCGRSIVPKAAATTAKSVAVVPAAHRPSTLASRPARLAMPRLQKGSWWSKKKVLVLCIAALLTAAALMYQISYTKHPGEEGKALALRECACAQQRSSEELRLKRAFLVNFDTYSFTEAGAPQRLFDSIEIALNVVSESCAASNRKKHNSMVRMFNKADLALFPQSYTAAKNGCTVPGGVADINRKAHEKIMAYEQQMQQLKHRQGQEAYNRMMDSIMKHVLPQEPISAGKFPE